LTFVRDSAKDDSYEHRTLCEQDRGEGVTALAEKADSACAIRVHRRHCAEGTRMARGCNEDSGSQSQTGQEAKEHLQSSRKTIQELSATAQQTAYSP
jgi:hypothetical protein